VYSLTVASASLNLLANFRAIQEFSSELKYPHVTILKYPHDTAPSYYNTTMLQYYNITIPSC
jgi:hypothetical protein